MTEQNAQSHVEPSFVRDVIPVLGGLSILFIIIGFVMIQINLLLRYQVFKLNIEVRNLIFASAAGFIELFVAFFVFETTVYLYSGNWRPSHREYFRQRNDRELHSFRDILQHDMRVLLSMQWVIYSPLAALWALGTILFLSILFFPLIATTTPAVLLFKEDIAIAGFPLTIDSTNPRRTMEVLKIIDLTDGVLILDERTQALVEVPRDALNGIVTYASVPQSLLLASTPEVMLTPESTPTESPP